MKERKEGKNNGRKEEEHNCHEKGKRALHLDGAAEG
jgi:hypothetical protein